MHQVDMGKLLGKVLREARERAGLSQMAVGNLLHVSKAAVGQWERGVNEPSTIHLVNLCDFLKIDLAAATGGLVQSVEYEPVSGQADDDDRAFLIEDRRNIAGKDKLKPKYPSSGDEIPVMETRGVRGLSITSEKKSIYPDFIISNSVTDLCQRPIGFVHTKGVEAIYVSDNNNSPRYEIGELLFFQIGRIPRLNDFVIVRYLFGPDEEGDGLHFANIGRVVRNDENFITISQINAKRDLEISKGDILSIDRIFAIHELFGK